MQLGDQEMTTFNPPTYTVDDKTYIPVLVKDAYTACDGCAFFEQNPCWEVPCEPVQRADHKNVYFVEHKK
jgi:hypothetical protein